MREDRTLGICGISLIRKNEFISGYFFSRWINVCAGTLAAREVDRIIGNKFSNRRNR